MEHSAGLTRLEEFVDTLLGQHARLKADNHALQRSLSERENEIKGLKQEVEQLVAEREEVGGRVAKLLGRIERWQQDQPPPDPVEQGEVLGSLMTGEPD